MEENEVEINKDELNNLINNLTDESIQIDVEHILRNIPENDRVFKNTCFNKIRDNTSLTIRDIKELYNDIHNPPEENDTTGRRFTTTQEIDRLRLHNVNYDYLIYNDKIVEMTPNQINLLIFNKYNPNAYLRTKMADFNLKLTSKTIDMKKEGVFKYVFTANDTLYYNFGVIDFLKIAEDRTYNAKKGQDVIKHIFTEKSRFVSFKKAKYILGFKNGWILPLKETEDKNYTILWDTDEQRSVSERSRKIYKSYTEKEKATIKVKLKQLIDQTQMPKEYLSILISYCIIAPFKIYFIKRYGLFPHLILSGKLTAGKTSVAELFTTYWYRHYKELTSGETAYSLARFEDIITASTLPLLIDEFNEVPPWIVNILKGMATSISDYKRKLSALKYISRPKVASLIITSNQLGDHFKDPANSSRAIVLEFQEPIKRDPIWIKLRDELKEYKLFSLTFDYTKEWKNKDLDIFMEKVNKTINLDNIIGKIEKKDEMLKNTDTKYPRIREIYQIIVAGAYMFRELTGIKLPLGNVFETLLESRRGVSGELLDQFIEFCNTVFEYTITYDPDFPSHHPSYITTSLRYNGTDGYNFTQNNLRNFNQYLQYLKSNRTNYKLQPLTDLLVEGLTDKDKIQYTTRRVNKKPTKVMVIKFGLLRDDLGLGTDVSI